MAARLGFLDVEAMVAVKRGNIGIGVGIAHKINSRPSLEKIELSPKMDLKISPETRLNIALDGPEISPESGLNCARDGPKIPPESGLNLASDGPKISP